MTKAELVFIPLPGVGHLIPMLEIAKLLVHHDERISISVLIIKRPSDPKQLAFDRSLGDPTLSKRIRFIDVPYIENFSDSMTFDLFSHVESHKSSVQEVITKLFRSEVGSDSPKFAGLVIDFFCTSMIEIARELDVPSYVFFPSGANFLSMMLHLKSISDEQGVDVYKLDSGTKLQIPGFFNPVPIEVFPRILFNEDKAAGYLGVFRKFRETKGILVNTFKDLESNSISFLSDDEKSPVLYPIGPLLNLKSNSQENSEKYSEILVWLDHQPQKSVVFLCFGSIGTFGEAQIKEIAFALERSGYRFLWSLRQTNNTPGGIPGEYENPEGVLPVGFLNRTAGIGKIIGWAPQAAILAHPSVGGFVTHCGWNSISESIWFSVPIATWPIYAEQQVNAFTMVKELGLAVDIKMDYWKDPENEIIVKSDVIEEGIRGVMELDIETRKKMNEMSEKSRKAIISGGSSYDSLGNFIGDVMKNMP